jgi:hypothetical protein
MGPSVCHDKVPTRRQLSLGRQPLSSPRARPQVRLACNKAAKTQCTSRTATHSGLKAVLQEILRASCHGHEEKTACPISGFRNTLEGA